MKTNQTIGSTQKYYLLKKIASIALFLLVIYILPLTTKPQLLLNWQVISLAVVCSILFATQPRVSIKESKQRNATDKNTMLLILFVSSAGQIISLLEWAYISKDRFGIDVQPFLVPPGMEFDTNHTIINTGRSLWTIAGAALLVGGTIFRLYAIRTLGKYFTSFVQIKTEHKIITSGPYRFLRHPSYTGAFIAMLGCAIFLQSILGIFIFGLGMLFVYDLRINTEEKTLLQNFKEEYAQYCSRTWKMFPLVW